MARIVPEDPAPDIAHGPGRKEWKTLHELADRLSDALTIHHGVHWARAEHRATIYGEIDFIVSNRLGRLVAIEQKNGEIDVGATDLIKHYADGSKGLRTQLNRNLNNLRTAFEKRHPGTRIDIDHLLFLPDCVIAGPLPASIDCDRVVDAANGIDGLAKRLEQMLEDRPEPASRRDTHGFEPPSALAVSAFLGDLVQVQPSIAAIRELAQARAHALSGGLATWARRLSFTPFRLRVNGTAGSGKTRLAIEELRAAEADGRTALYVCFNRALADRMRASMPNPAVCHTFHELATWVATEAGCPPDWAEPDAYDQLARTFGRLAQDLAGSVDLLIVDEGQDFRQDWCDALLLLPRPDARVLWLEDPGQTLYGHPPAVLPDWTTLRSPVNYRSPHLIVTLANALRLCDPPMEAGGPIRGFDPILRGYTDAASLRDQTALAVQELIDAGHRPEDITVLSWHGLERSELLRCDSLAGQTVRKPTGQRQADGTPVFTSGPLALDTVYRFKGLSTDCLVLSEIDFTAFDEAARRRLFVGLTRARLKLTLVAAPDAQAAIIGQLTQR